MIRDSDPNLITFLLFFSSFAVFFFCPFDLLAARLSSRISKTEISCQSLVRTPKKKKRKVWQLTFLSGKLLRFLYQIPIKVHKTPRERKRFRIKIDSVGQWKLHININCLIINSSVKCQKRLCDISQMGYIYLQDSLFHCRYFFHSFFYWNCEMSVGIAYVSFEIFRYNRIYMGALRFRYDLVPKNHCKNKKGKKRKNNQKPRI